MWCIRLAAVTVTMTVTAAVVMMMVIVIVGALLCGALDLLQ
jgi:hypothetical protein